ncbi:MAG: hypothetical protein ACSHX0_06910 [Akkermansiaceae bacterium]
MVKAWNTEELIKSHEFTLTRDERGFWSGTQVYYCYKDKLATLVPQNLSVHPDYNFIWVEGVDVKGEEAGWLKLEVKYAGTTSNDDNSEDSEPTYSLDLALSEEPLETHERYNELSPEDIQEAVNQARNPKTDDEGKPVEVDISQWDDLKSELYDYLRKGFESYRDPKVTWSVDWVSTALPSGLSDIGQISSPDGNPPNSGGGRNWLFVGLRTRQRGRVFENSAVWELSGRGGWNADIYS